MCPGQRLPCPPKLKVIKDSKPPLKPQAPEQLGTYEERQILKKDHEVVARVKKSPLPPRVCYDQAGAVCRMRCLLHFEGNSCATFRCCSNRDLTAFGGETLVHMWPCACSWA